ncbi:MAG: PD-(D/E)XK nuclease family protein [bacterium]
MIDHISPSMLGTWLRCGEQFRRRYIEDERIPPGVSARRGSAVHKVAELNYTHKKLTGEDMPLADLKDACRDEYVRLIRDEGVYFPPQLLPEKAGLLNRSLDEALKATALFRSEIAPRVTPLETELPVEEDLGFGLPVVGILDLVEPEGRLSDLKVMDRKGQEWADRELQPTFYCALWHAKTGQWPAAFRFDLIVPNKTPVHVELTTQRTPKDLEVLARYVRNFLKDLEAGVFRPADPGHWVCRPLYCGYYMTCPYTTGGNGNA